MNVGPGLPSRLPAPSHNPLLVPAYSLAVAGPARAGKSSLLRLLLHTAPISPHATQLQLDSLARFLRPSPPDPFPECEIELLSARERLLLRLIDTPPLDFSPGAEDDLERALRDILHFVESRYIDGARDEATVGESHVHLCLYVLDPTTIVPRQYPYRHRSPPSPPSSASSQTSLPPAEITAIRRLSSRVNVLPVLGHTDSISLARLAELKRAVRHDLAEAGLGFGIFDDDATAPCASPADDLALPLLPYALFAPETFLTQPPAPVDPDHDDDDARLAVLQGRFTRRFRAGVLDALDPRHSDFVALRRAAMLHHKALKKYTKDYLYERFKVDSLLAAQNHRQGRVHPGSVHALLNHRDDRETDLDYARREPALSPLHNHHAPRLPPVVFDREDDERERLHQRERERERERDREREREDSQRELIVHEETPPGRKRKITMACNFCRSRKLKCDGVRPACAQCVKRGNSCDYQPHAGGHAHGGHAWKYKRATAAVAAAAAASAMHTGEQRMHEDVDELDEEASSASEPYAPRKRVSVDMLIAATLDHPGLPAPPPVAPSASVPMPAAARASPPQPRATPPQSSPLQQVPQVPAPWYDSAGAGTGMGVLDVGSEGDKKKRLNRQSANYGSKAVACVHCRARKTRCDAARPACGNCARRALVCSYVHTQPSQPRSKGKKAAAAAAAAAAGTAGTTTTNSTTSMTGDAGGGSPTPAGTASPPPRAAVSPTPSAAAAYHMAHGHTHTHTHAHGHGHTHTLAAHHAGHGHAPFRTHAGQTLHVHGHGHGHGHGQWPRSPVPVDSALEESAERERPRSPAAPPIAVLEGKAGGVNGRHVVRTPEREREREREREGSVGSAESGSGAGSVCAGVKRGAGLEEEEEGEGRGMVQGGGPVEKRAKWEVAAPAPGVNGAAVPDGVRV